MGSGKGGSSWANACTFGAGCKSSKRSKDKFCDKHSKCDWHRCNVKVLDVEGDDFKYSSIGHSDWLCRDHSCKAKDKDKQCYEERYKNSQYCKEHSKEFQCKMPKCDSDRDGSERYCKKHHCGVDDCHRRVLSLANDEMAGRDKKKCYKHQRCEALRDCKNYSLWDPDKTPTRLCVNHSKCEFFQACNGFAQGDSRFCTDHECDQQGCLQPRDVHNGLVMRWCHMHLCSAPGCPDFANGHGHAHPQKCFRHTCQRAECSEIVQDNNPNSHFCLTHACADPAAVRLENAVLHSSPPFAHFMVTRERDNKRDTIIILLLLLEQHLARVAGLVAMTPGAGRGHFAPSNTITQHIRIRFRPQKPVVDMRIIT
nr:hypothetical protein FVER53263_21055 [Fusarium verticillioides]